MTKRIIIIDDDLMFCRLIQQSFIDVLGYRADYTHASDEMYEMIRKAETDGDPYHLATIDMDFRMDGTDITFAQGHQILAKIKADFPYIMCIMVSGANIDAAHILKMRDEQDLDFFVNKRTMQPLDFKTHIQHVFEYRSHNKPAPPVTTDSADSSQARVFISYRRQNTWGKARAIANSLREHDIDVFLDVDNIGSGAFPPYILQAIVESKYFVLLLSPGTLESEWVRKEIGYALEMEKTIIPVLLDGFQFTEDNISPEFENFYKLNTLIITPQTYKGDIDRLVNQYLIQNK